MTTKDNATDEAQIRKLSDDWVKAIRSKDLNSLMPRYTQGILVFDLAPPLQYAGQDAYRKNMEEWFTSFQGPIGYQVRSLTICAGADVAFSHSLNHISGTRTDSEETDVWVRATVGYRKVNGKWLITHEHFSTPFEMVPPYKASLDLKP
jgi:ketosteroid isomerase-like protein